MSSNCNDIMSILLREGTDQMMRNQTYLDPNTIQLQDFGIEEWMKFAYHFAQDVNFFSTLDAEAPDGNWQDFFKDDTELKKLLSTYKSENNLTAHLTLFICFIKLIDFSKNRFNELTKRHLDFYYSEILKISKLPETNDKVHVLFELAQNIDQTTLPLGTELDGGKDQLGKKRIYSLTEDFYPNKAKTVAFKSVYNDPNGQIGGLNYPIKCAPVANSFDGITANEFPKDDQSWYAFGYKNSSNGAPELPNAKLGFAVGSSLLNLSEGTRNVVAQIQFQSITDNFTSAQLKSCIDVYYTSEEGWTGPLSLSETTVTILGTTDDNASDNNYNTHFSSQKLTLVVSLDSGNKPTSPYNPLVHGYNYSSEHPIFKFIVRTDTIDGYSVYKNWTKEISKVALKIAVSDLRNVRLESDTGTLNNAKPFYPFTTNPVKGSRFSVFNEEIFSKNWKNIQLKIRWKNTPDSFNDLYRAYDRSFEESVAKDWFAPIVLAQSYPIANTLKQNIYPPLDKRGYYSKYNSIVFGNSYFKANAQLYNENKWQPLSSNITLFNILPPEIDQQTLFETNVQFSGSTSTDSESGIALTLNQSFLHELYPRIYALALMDTDKGTLIPNQPYTPFADYVSINYTAETELVINVSDQDVFENRSIQLYHEHPFGEAEEHLYLKKMFNPYASKAFLAPTYCKGGEFYIGIENAKILQQVSLLVQVKEGSENTLTESFEGDQKIVWDILCSNNWKPLENSTFMLLNQTDNFLKSGLVKFSIPKEASSNNTLLPSGMFWIRAKMYKNFDAVCKLLSIDAQASIAEFDNRTNDLAHLENGIPADTIQKLVNRSALVKTVKQPYNSFGGKIAETDAEFYRRVSERLRHKNRTITLWDYEHIILQKFPEIFQVKCLNHTCAHSYLSPGNVRILVIPDTLEKNVFDRFQPRVSKALLNEIGNHINKLNSLHVNATVTNPMYEELKISLKVKFYDGLDIPIHIQKLNHDLSMYLSPWAFKDREEFTFGLTIYKTVLINYLEKLDYVDYLQDVQLIKDGVSTENSCSPSTPASIIVSAKKHDISTDIIECISTDSTIKNSETCQL